jgi:L-fuconolactonase
MRHRISRRSVLGGLAAAAIASSGLTAGAAASPPDSLIIDTHQHLWDLSKFKLAWVENSSIAEYRGSHRNEEYLEATRGLNLKAVYMEVDMPPEQRMAEAEYVFGLCRANNVPTIAAVVGGRPDGAGFSEYIKKCNASGFLRGVRQALHGSNTPGGTCLSREFIEGILFLGKQDLCFDLCMRPEELGDGLKLSERCPDTKLVIDHCGNADPQAFAPEKGSKPSHDVEMWKRDMAALAKQPNVICKISGIVARAPQKWTAADLAPIVNHCLDVFGPDKVVFGGDWPICLRRAGLAQWIDALAQIIKNRPLTERRKLWADNARRFYAMDRLLP